MEQLDLYNQSFSTAHIAGMLGISPQAVSKRALKRGWQASSVKIQGGGSLWLFKDMDANTRTQLARAAIKEHQATHLASAEHTAQMERAIAARWEEFDKKPASIKDRAFYKMELLVEVLRLHKDGATLTTAFKAVAAFHGVSASTMRNWYFGAGGKQGVRGIDPKDWAPFLADNYKGRVKRAQCDATAWEFLKKDYLRIESPSFLSSFRRLSLAADLHGWIIPSARTLYRRLFEEIERAVIAYLRTKKLVNDFPDQERKRDTFRPGEAVSGDALRFDRVFVRDEASGEVFNPCVWFFEDVYSGKILAWDSDKTENSDMFRKAVYQLTDYCLPRHMYIDNTRAAANKSLTGQVAGRHRFTDRATDPVGLLKLLHIDVHFTNPDHEVASPGSKPIERAFGIGNLHASLRQWPSLINRATPSRPIPYSEFLSLLPLVVAEHNRRTGRTGGICRGRSFDQVFEEGLRQTTLRRASDELRRLLLFSQEVCTVKKQGVVVLNAGKGESRHRYYGEALLRHIREKVAVLFNPEDLSEGAFVYDLEGRMLCRAQWLQAVAFNDTRTARAHARHKTRRARFIKKAAKEAVNMSDLEYLQLNAVLPADRIPEPRAVTTVLSSMEAEQCLSGPKVSSSRKAELMKNLHRNIRALGREKSPLPATGT